MTDILRVLGQLIPANNVLTDLYAVPANTQTSISSITICNQNSSQGVLFSISVGIGGAADNPAQYVYYQLPLDINDTFIATVGFSLAAGDVVRCLIIGDNVSVNLFGVEVL